jgi:hypothetical protein
MARVAAVEFEGIDPEQLDPGMRVQLGVGGIISHRPEIAAALGAVSEATTTAGRSRDA